MGSSFVEFEECGFWTRDAWLQIWLGCLVAEVDRWHETPDWLRDWRDYAHIQAANAFVGCVSAGLKEFVTLEERRQQMIALCDMAGQRMDRFGINASEIDVEWVSTQSNINAAVNEGILAFRQAFMRLLHHQCDDYDKSNRRNWNYNQVAPLAWWRAPRV